MPRSVRVTFTEAEAEALLDTGWPPRYPVTRLHARGKLTSALLADAHYEPPAVREPGKRLPVTGSDWRSLPPC